MYNYDLKSYVKLFDNRIDEYDRNQILNELKNAKWQKHFYASYLNEREQSDHEFDVIHLDDYDELIKSPIMLNLRNIIWNTIKDYILVEHKSMNSWFSGWNGFTIPRFNKYETGTIMNVHCDHIYNIFDGNIKGIPTLTVLGSLNDDYEGGEFVMFEDLILPLKAGQIVVFPSNFMYPHKVLPVKSGCRYSFVSWVW